MSYEPEEDSRGFALVKYILRIPLMLMRGFMNCLTWATEKSERFFRFFGDRFASFIEVITRADTWAGRVTRVLSTTIGWLLWPFTRLMPRVATTPLFRKIAKATYWLWYPFLAISAFFLAFIQTRRRAVFTWGIPIFFLLGIFAIIVWQLTSFQRSEILRGYRQAIELAISQRQFEQAFLYQQKLQQLGSPAEQLGLREVEKLAREQKIAEALLLVERLAPLDRPGFAAAHFWAAQLYLTGVPDITEAEAVRRADLHLQHLQTALKDPSYVTQEFPAEIGFLIAMVRLKQQRIEEAIEELNLIAHRFWPANLMRFEVFVQLGFEREAIRDSLLMSQWIRRDPKILDEIQEAFYPLWTKFLFRSGQKDAWVEAIGLWFDRFPDNIFAMRPWAMIQIDSMEAYLNRGGEADVNRAALILQEAARRIGAANRDFLAGWLAANAAHVLPNSSMIRMVRRAETLEGNCTAMFELLGTVAATRNEPERAERLLTEAVKLSSTNTIAYNNLAYVISTNNPERADEALGFANRAVELEPRNIEILETRGMILIQLKKWHEAINDLNLVIAARPTSKETHAALGLAHRSLGEHELAKLHEELAN